MWINLYEGNLVDREKGGKSDSYSSVQFLQLVLVLPPSLPPSPSVHCPVTACVKWQHVFHDRMIFFSRSEESLKDTADVAVNANHSEEEEYPLVG